jgi:transcriptional regulator with AAA-type ATPase domain
MFGHAKGAFTGATGRRIGKFAAADPGTLLIDVVGIAWPPKRTEVLTPLTATWLPLRASRHTGHSNGRRAGLSDVPGQ